MQEEAAAEESRAAVAAMQEAEAMRTREAAALPAINPANSASSRDLFASALASKLSREGSGFEEHARRAGPSSGWRAHRNFSPPVSGHSPPVSGQLPSWSSLTAFLEEAPPARKVYEVRG